MVAEIEHHFQGETLPPDTTEIVVRFDEGAWIEWTMEEYSQVRAALREVPR